MNYSYMGLLLAKTGDAADALDFANRGRAIAEELITANPANAELRGLLAFACTTLAGAQVEIASSGKTASEDRGSLQGY